MPSSIATIRKSFLATRNSNSGGFLLTEKFDSENGFQTVFLIVEAKDVKDGKSIQRILQSEFVKPFMASSSFSISNLEESLHFVNKKLEVILSGGSSDKKINSLICMIEKDQIHLSMIGEIEGYLLRKGKINSVTEDLSSSEELGFINITSGELIAGDQIIFGNKNLFDRLSLDRIRRTLQQFSPRAAIKDFYLILRKSKRLDCNAIILEAVNPTSSVEESDNLPECLYLDEIVESPLLKLYKKAKPIAAAFSHDIARIAAKAASNAKVIAEKSSSNIKSTYVPKTKELLASTNSRAIEGFTKFSKNSKLVGHVKVKPYSKSTTRMLPPFLSDLFAIVLSGLQALFKKENRRYLYALLIIILIAGAYSKISSNDSNRDIIKQQNDATAAYDKASEAFSSAKEDIGLDRSDGIAKLNDALALAKTATTGSSVQDKALLLVKEIQTKLDENSKTKRFYDQKPIFSFKYDCAASAIAGSVIYGISNDGKVYSTDSREKDPRLKAAIDANLGTPISAVYSSTMNILFVLTNQAKVWAYDEQSQSGAEVKVEADGAFEEATSISTFSTSIYLLDSKNGKIWRHSKNNEVFTAGKTYAQSKNTDAKDGISLAIDGAVYSMKPDGNIVKFAHNITDTSFVIQSPPSPNNVIRKAVQIATDADSQHLYILDEADNRIISFAKDGQYINQYITDGITISQILLNPRVQKMWTISGKDVYELDL